MNHVFADMSDDNPEVVRIKAEVARAFFRMAEVESMSSPRMIGYCVIGLNQALVCMRDLLDISPVRFQDSENATMTPDQTFEYIVDLGTKLACEAIKIKRPPPSSHH